MSPYGKLESLPQKLNQSRLIVLRSHLTKLCRSKLCVRRRELHMVEQIEELTAKLHCNPFCNMGVFGDSEIEIHNALCPQIGVDSRLIPKLKRPRQGVASRIKPFADAGLRRSADVGVASGDKVRPRYARSSPRPRIPHRKIRGECVRCSIYECKRKTRLNRRNAIHCPTRGQLVHEPI